MTMTWLAFGAGMLLGILLGGFILELIQSALDYRVRKKLPLDRHLL